MYKILVVDDEIKIRELVRKYAEFEGHIVKEASDGRDAISLISKEDFDIVILDIMMPVLDGFSACAEIRKFSSVPIIILSARNEEYDKISGFRLGIDDYVTKPFSPRELMLRVNAVAKRASFQKSTHKIYTLGALTVDFTARTVTINGSEVSLSPKEYELLFYMIKNKNIALTREKLICEIWGYDYDGDDRTLDTHIKLLRRSLGELGHLIVTLRGVGYRFEDRQSK